MPEDVVPEDVVPEDVVPEDVAPEDVAPHDAAGAGRGQPATFSASPTRPVASAPVASGP